MQTRAWLCVVALVAAGCDDSRMGSDAGTVPPGTDAGEVPPGTDAGPGAADAGMMQMPTSPLVDPTCVDGMFSETLPNPAADISDLVAGYSSVDAVPFIEQSLMRRYTTGYVLVDGGRTSLGDCVEVFLSDRSSASEVIDQLSTIVHECGHFYDLDQGGFSNNVYYVNDSPLVLTCSGGDAASRGGNTFERSRIRRDTYQPQMPGDFYADVYLDGDPDDANPDGGDQGFNMLFEETVQYVNSLATSYAYTSELNTGGSSSQRDGILTFLWYVTRYLRMARLDFPTAYDFLVNGDGGCWRRAILTVWGRAWLYLDVTDGMSHLGINDAQLEALVMAPELLEEIQRLRDAEGCGG